MKSSYLFGTLFIVLLIASCKCTRKILLFSCTIIFICCSSPRNTGLKNDRKLWEEANKYRATITDSTFLKTTETMSYDAIDAMNTKGLNNDYAYNQVVYLEALTRAKKRLSVKDNRLVLNLTSGKEAGMSEDLFQFIVMVINSWNTWIGEGRHEIIKTAEGYYDISPIHENVPSMYNNGYILNKQSKTVGYYSNGYILDKEKKIQGYYSNGYILDKDRNVIGNYANGHITLKNKLTK